MLSFGEKGLVETVLCVLSKVVTLPGGCYSYLISASALVRLCPSHIKLNRSKQQLGSVFLFFMGIPVHGRVRKPRFKTLSLIAMSIKSEDNFVMTSTMCFHVLRMKFDVSRVYDSVCVCLWKKFISGTFSLRKF